MAGIHITDIESAINWWRVQAPSDADLGLSEPLRALAEVYALLVYHHEVECDEETMPAPASAVAFCGVMRSLLSPISVMTTSSGSAVACRNINEVR
mgnify:CR=1 FL=1